LAMACAAWRTVWLGPTVSTIVLMPSRTRIRTLSPNRLQRLPQCYLFRQMGEGRREAVPS
jgi:hypothetical protein